MTPAISDEVLGAVVVTHQSRSDVVDCLEALLAHRPQPRVALVDNASDDGTAELVRARFGGQVDLRALDRNTGFAAGCNLGLAALPASCTVVAFVNPDVQVGPSTLAEAAEALLQDDRTGAVAPRLMRGDRTTVDSVGQVLDRRTLEVVDRGYGGRVDRSLERPRPVLAACGALAVCRRSALESVALARGVWDESFFCFWEDLELGWRLNNRGWRVLAVPTAVAIHRRGSGAAPGTGPLRWRRSVELEACILGNRWLTLMRHLHALDLLQRLPVLLIWDLLAVSAGAVRRPRLLSLLAARGPALAAEWKQRSRHPRRRLADLPCWSD